MSGACAPLAALALALTAAGEDWSATWQDLARLRAADAPADAPALRAALTERARALADDPRGLLLGAELDLLAGHDVAEVASRLEALEPRPFRGVELWFLADVLRSPARAAVVLEALEDPAPLERWQLLLAWNTAVEEARELRLAGAAIDIQRELHRRYQADWSAIDLALSLRNLGDAQGADQTLAQTIERETGAGRPTAELWSQRGIAALGAGDEARGRDFLGRALASGSDDAGLVLGRLDLVAGRADAARRGFRPSILRTPPADWALRGWGLSLLPAPADAPALRRPPLPSPPND